jgi:hypothetical protein
MARLFGVGGLSLSSDTEHAVTAGRNTIQQRRPAVDCVRRGTEPVQRVWPLQSDADQTVSFLSNSVSLSGFPEGVEELQTKY